MNQIDSKTAIQYVVEAYEAGMDKAKELIIMGFISAFREELPTEYAVELNRLLAINIGDK